VEAADISLDALEVARINVDRHHLDSRITLIESDGLAACAGPVRPDFVQPALCQRGQHGGPAP
jgi:methylase of polypeptide subunit release factors